VKQTRLRRSTKVQECKRPSRSRSRYSVVGLPACPRKNRPWAKTWSPGQIARRLPIDFPDAMTMRISHEAIATKLSISGAIRSRPGSAAPRTEGLLANRCPERAYALGSSFYTLDVIARTFASGNAAFAWTFAQTRIVRASYCFDGTAAEGVCVSLVSDGRVFPKPGSSL
jgi:hypothetical protein